MTLSESVKSNLLFLDGGMGTLLQSFGLCPGEVPEEWNLSHPNQVSAVHRAYFDAGCNIVNTNTFGVNGIRYTEEELSRLIPAAFENARRAKEESRGTQEKWIALDIGPSGRMLRPFGDLDFEDAVEGFAKAVRIGAACGADLIFIETMNDSLETKAALLAAKENSDLPVFVSNAYGEDGKLLSGTSPEGMVAMLEGMGADAIGTNCSFGPDQLSPIIEKYLACASVPVLLKPNAGLPKVVNGKTAYDVSPDDFAEKVAFWIEKGVRIAGGCCGTTPEYLEKLVARAGSLTPVPVEEKSRTAVSSATRTVLFGTKPVLIGERINPTGKKPLKEALRRGDTEFILREGIAQQESGAEILDVNVGIPEIDEKAVLDRTVTALQTVVEVPLQIDTSDPCAMETALRHYNGKAMINSVNGKEESMKAVFPLVKKYGGVVVALTLDENGIPADADGRVKIAEKILSRAKEYGIAKKDIVFDPLAMTVSTDPGAAAATLSAVERITKELGCHTSLGVSNVSFGLPKREWINSTFFALALEKGLSAAIMNPFSVEMKKAYHTYLALSGKDEHFAGFFSFADSVSENTETQEAQKKNAAPLEVKTLSDAIRRGLGEAASKFTEELLSEKEALAVIREEIVPALDLVGMEFEKKTMYLPQLLMSAEAAKAAFDVIKSKAVREQTEAKCPVVLATVKGDIHDIGKNIVKLLLENYGFAVTDLGKDIAPEEILEAVLRLKAPLAGLSALMTTTVPAMEKTVALLHEKAPFCRVMVGGAVLTKEYAEAIGADRYAADAMESVRFAEEVNRTLPETK